MLHYSDDDDIKWLSDDDEPTETAPLGGGPIGK